MPVVAAVPAVHAVQAASVVTAVPAATEVPTVNAVHAAPAVTAVLGAAVGLVEALVRLVETSSGPLALVVVFVYSFLIAFVLPGPSEVVLGVAETPLLVGFPYGVRLALIMLVSAAGKAVGSVLAFHIGQEAKRAGPVVRWLRRSRFDVVEWSEKKTVQLAKRYGYAGLAMALSVPFFPDTLSIYAFAVLEEDYLKFAAATFAGSLGRLLVTIGLFAGGFAIV